MHRMVLCTARVVRHLFNLNALADQNWNSAFGSLYLTNINWNVYTFGKLKSKENIEIADTEVQKADLNQEIFQHQVKTAAAYFNLLVSQRLENVQYENYKRSEVIYTIAKARAESGLIPEVDASLPKRKCPAHKLQPSMPMTMYWNTIKNWQICW
ncbi:hypothetical protein EJ377_14305 [Chryseobacterium arthrosphaerae]|uniref:TolC family protein n=1 Tax=Chryseobacterium arthrosphaerae TaxID=651561 RepID=A0A432DST7_9FLAO|nr:hypothetical protein EJ377_14305 [Chryseobacterium arthrosphaerae]